MDRGALVLGLGLVVVGWWMSRPRFAASPLTPAAIAAARALRAQQRAAKGLPSDGLPGSPWGPRPDPLNPSVITFHGGADFAVPTGTPVFAVDDGVVVEARESVNAGRLIRYDTAHGRVSVMHLSAIGVAVGDTVKAGQQIGASGNTGARTTGAHLHLEYLPHGARGTVDPLPLIPE